MRRKTDHEPRERRTYQPRGQTQSMISTRLSVAYLRIIEAESIKVGASKALFLTMLIKGQESGVALRRLVPTAYTIEPEELGKKRLFVWKAADELRERIDRERARLGQITVSDYLVHLINMWLEMPNGLPIGPAKRAA